jgi:Domain of unknown function (DUF5615)
MALVLANENGPENVVVALKSDGHDVVWMRDVGPGSPDDQVLALALAEGRIVLTFDKDFGELAFRLGQVATPRRNPPTARLRSPSYLVRFARAVLSTGHTWEGHFPVAEEGRLRLVPLPR